VDPETLTTICHTPWSSEQQQWVEKRKKNTRKLRNRNKKKSLEKGKGIETQ
jgi:hypothetical protein